MRTLIKTLLVGLLISFSTTTYAYFQLKEGAVIPVGGYCTMEAVDAIIVEAKKSVKRGNAMTVFQTQQGNCRRAIARGGPFIIKLIKRVKYFVDVDKDKFEIWSAETHAADGSIRVVYVMNQVAND